MHTEKSSCYFVLVLSVVSLGLGVYKAATLGAVSNDSVTFIEFAEMLAVDPTGAIRQQDQHPGFPAGILLVQTLIERLTGTQSVAQAIVAGQMINLLSRTIAAGFLYAVFLFFTNRKAAFLSTLAVLLIAVYADNGSDVLSDWPNLMFMSIAFFCCLKGLTRQKAWWFLFAGLASGAAYWIRPEGLFFLPVMGVFVVIQLRQSSCRWFLLRSLCVMAVTALLITSPYMLCKGKLFPKKHVGELSQLGLVQTQNVSPGYQPQVVPSTKVSSYARAVLHFLEKTMNSIYLLAVPLLAAVFRRLVRPARLRPQDRLLAIFIILWMLMMLWLYDTHRYMSHRHIMPMLIFACAWLYAGTLWLARRLGSHIHSIHRHSQIILAVCLAVFVPKLVTPARTEKAVYRQAGMWLSENTPPDAYLLVFDSRIGFYAGRSYRVTPTHETITPGYLVVRTNDQPGVCADAVLLDTGNDTMDERIQIYALPDL